MSPDSQLERLLHLFFWTDPRLSTLFVSCCLACALVLLVVPPNYVASLCGLYLMRPPQSRRGGRDGHNAVVQAAR